MWSIQSPPLPLDAWACSSDFSVPPTPGVAPLLTRDDGVLLRVLVRAQIYRRRGQREHDEDRVSKRRATAPITSIQTGRTPCGSASATRGHSAKRRSAASDTAG